jgi:hypothetical protein
MGDTIAELKTYDVWLRENGASFNKHGAVLQFMCKTGDRDLEPKEGKRKMYLLYGTAGNKKI